MGGGTRAAILWKKGGEARMSYPPKSKGPAARSAFACPPLIFSPRLQLLWADPAAQALAPGLCGQGGALKLLRAHPGAWELLRAGRGVSLLLPGPGDGALELALLPGPEGNYHGFLCAPCCAALPRGFPARLRGPLTEAFALLPLLARQLDAAADPAPLLELERCCYRLLHSVCLLSGLSLLSGGQLPGRAADLSSVARGLCEAARGALLPGLPAIRWTGPQTQLPVSCGAELLSLAVGALLDNALRFSQDGGEIAVSVSALPGRALLRIRDQGTGIRPDVLPHICEPFFSAGPGGDGGAGTGLGLAFVQSLAARLGGVLSVESVFGEGSCFALSLPLAKDAADTHLRTGADYLLDRYSAFYVQLCDFCRLPDLV